MQANHITPQTTPGRGSGAPDLTPARKLEQARERVKSALHAAEDSNLHPEAFDDIARPLVLALRDMDDLTISFGALVRADELHTN